MIYRVNEDIRTVYVMGIFHELGELWKQVIKKT